MKTPIFISLICLYIVLLILSFSLQIPDFGFAKHILKGAELHTLRGSPLYMAPEIICKRKYDSRVDLWSIGVILYGNI